MKLHTFKPLAIAFHLLWVTILFWIFSWLAPPGELMTRTNQLILGANFCAGAMIGAGVYFWRPFYGLFYSLVFIVIWAGFYCLASIFSGRVGINIPLVILGAFIWIAMVMWGWRADMREKSTHLK